MGICSSNMNKLPPRVPGQANPFYWACRNGEIDKVRKMLPNLTYEQVNEIQPNGSTALHAACFYNHPQIVQLLLNSGCSRTIVNSHGNTAYQETTIPEIRTLFERPPSKRFVDENATESFKLLTKDGNDVKKGSNVPDDWVKGHTSADDAHEAQFMIAMASSSNPLKQIVKSQAEKESIQNVTELVSHSVPEKHLKYKTMRELYDKFMKKMGVGHLLSMYTLETPLYKNLQTDVDSFTVLLYFHLDELQDRTFQGRSYRGATMTQSDIGAYRWALEREGYVLETRVLQSTSLEKSKAQMFAALKPNEGPHVRHSVLLTLDFPQKCPTAINLNKISETIPALSEFEDEQEILVLPYTLFSVRDIKIDSQSGQYRITLTNVPTPKTSLLECIKHVQTD